MSLVYIQETTAAAIARQLLTIGAIKLNHEKPFTWSSGWKSPIYCDNRMTLSYPPLRGEIKRALALAVQQHFSQAQAIAGVATAGIAQGALVAEELTLPYAYVRPKAKEHGMGNQIEGKLDKGQKVVLVEDLISTGGSSLKAAEALQAAGIKVIGMVAIFTYGFEVAEKNFEAAKIPLVCLSDFNHLLREAVEQKLLNETQLVYVKSWRLDPANWK
jgi:orotate phosphoribosyltransferase